MGSDRGFQNGDDASRDDSDGGGQGEEQYGLSHQGSQSREAANQGAGRSRSNWWYLLLLIPLVGLLYPPFYDSVEPVLWGLPFFIWYQFLWVFLGVAVTVVVYSIRG